MKSKLRIFIIGLLVIGGAGALLLKTKNLGRTTEAEFVKIWQADLKNLRAAKALPESFDQVKNVMLFTPSANLEKFFGNHSKEIFQTKPDGAYVLQVFLDEIEEGGVVVQYDIIDMKSGNTIWELGRTFSKSP